MRGAILGIIVPLYGWYNPAYTCFYTGYYPPCMNLIISSFVTLPSLPVPGIESISIPSFFAMCLTAGVANALELPGDAECSLLLATYPHAAAFYSVTWGLGVSYVVYWDGVLGVAAD